MEAVFNIPTIAMLRTLDELSEFIEKYLVPAVRGIAVGIEGVNTPELFRQYKEGVLSRGPSTFDWYI